MIPVFFLINFRACAFFRESGATILNYHLFITNVILRLSKGLCIKLVAK